MRKEILLGDLFKGCRIISNLSKFFDDLQPLPCNFSIGRFFDLIQCRKNGRKFWAKYIRNRSKLVQLIFKTQLFKTYNCTAIKNFFRVFIFHIIGMNRGILN
ncbi:hypothetical protein NCPPB3923_19380 [Burkholderia glumae]|nr:hypothetical protein NCPPB3923_19380 [Burkholderia glumae]